MSQSQQLALPHSGERNLTAKSSTPLKRAEQPSSLRLQPTLVGFSSEAGDSSPGHRAGALSKQQKSGPSNLLDRAISSSTQTAPWKQLHHWQGLSLVLLMFPLGLAVVTGSALLEQANSRGLEEGAIAAVFKPNGPLDTLVSGSRGSGRKPILKRRQRKAVQAEVNALSEQLQRHLDKASAAEWDEPSGGDPSQIRSSKPPQAQAVAVFPDLRQPQAEEVPLPRPSLSNATPTDVTLTDIASFVAIALGSEFSLGSQPGIPHIRKWTQDLRIRIHGQPTAADLTALEQVVAEINQLLNEVEPVGAVKLGFVDGEGSSNPNLDIFFVPEQDFSRYETSYQPVNHGFFWSEADQGAIQRGRILISTTDTNQAERSHLIREELTQSLGLMQDSPTNADSIFYQGWSQTQAYSPQDKRLLKLLYRADIRPGMDAIAVQQVLLGS